MKNLIKKLCLSTILAFAFLTTTNFNKSTFAMESNTSALELLESDKPLDAIVNRNLNDRAQNILEQSARLLLNFKFSANFMVDFDIFRKFAIYVKLKTHTINETVSELIDKNKLTQENLTFLEKELNKLKKVRVKDFIENYPNENDHFLVDFSEHTLTI